MINDHNVVVSMPLDTIQKRPIILTPLFHELKAMQQFSLTATVREFQIMGICDVKMTSQGHYLSLF